MNREKIREHTMQAIYQMDATGNFDYTALNPIEEAAAALAKPQAEKTLTAVRDHIDEIDELIASNLDKWTIDRVSKTDLAILRNAAAEMLYNEDLPVKVSINEAVKLSKRYGDEKSYAFVNSVLSKMEKTIGR